MDAEERKAEKLARKAEERQWTKQSKNLLVGHLEISNGIMPGPLGIEPKGAKGALVINIHRLQQELVEDARLQGEEGIANMKKELEARKLLDEIENSYHEKYEAGLRKLRDDLRLAALADANEQTVDTLGEILRCLDQSLAKASPEVKRKTAESLSTKFGVSLAGSVDVQETLAEVETPDKKKHPRDSPDHADESQTKKNKGSENNDVVSDSDDEGADGADAEKTENEIDTSSENMNAEPTAKETVTEHEDEVSSKRINDEPSAKETEVKDDSSSDETKQEPSAEDNKPNPANDSSNKMPDNAIIAAFNATTSTPEVHATTANDSVHGSPKLLAAPTELQQVLAQSTENHAPSTSTTTTTTVTTTSTTTTTKTVTTSTGEVPPTSSLP
jgi:hypothetical protein